MTGTFDTRLRWDEVVLDRTNERWRDLLCLAKLLLGDRSQTTTCGASREISMLFEMNVLFEEYVGRLMARAIAGTDMRVTPQGGRLYCLTKEENGQGLFQTKPDILIKRGMEVIQIVNTKLKLQLCGELEVSVALLQPPTGTGKTQEACVYAAMAAEIPKVNYVKGYLSMHQVLFWFLDPISRQYYLYKIRHL
jgi:hypothetical protein